MKFVRLLPARGSWLLPGAMVVVVAVGIALHVLDRGAFAGRLWQIALIAGSAPLLVRTAGKALRGDFATDAVAALAIIAAIALGQPLPGLIVVLMQSGGESLERMAERRATRELRQLEQGAPRIAHRRHVHLYVDVPVTEVRIGNHLLVRPGEIVPVDGRVLEGSSHLNTAQITGEPAALAAAPGTPLFSGYWNLEGALVMEALAPAAESQYERIVQLVRDAQASEAPIKRLADRYAAWFTPLTIVVAALAYLISGDAERILAVLVVATPCPLILATPVALIGGINSCARMKVIIRGGAALERLTTIRAVVFDKTGTLTTGTPAVTRLHAFGDVSEDSLLALAASIEQGSGHTLARAIVDHAHSRRAHFTLADNVVEVAGSGVRGVVDGRRVAVGSREFLADTDLQHLATTSIQRSYIAIDDVLAGFIEFDDRPRDDLVKLMTALRTNGMQRLAILSGDDRQAVERIAAPLHVDEVHGDLKPDDKLAHVRRLMQDVGPCLMIGDGTNDAPALAAATVGMAITPRGGGIAAETADVIMLGDNLLRVVDTLTIAHRTLRIARQSIVVGLALSGIGMLLAAVGLLPPVAGAIAQEAIDVAVIVNALRASAPLPAAMRG